MTRASHAARAARRRRAAPLGLLGLSAGLLALGFAALAGPLAAQSQASRPLAAQTQASRPLAAQSQASRPLAAQSQASRPLAAQTQAPEPLAAGAEAPETPDILRDGTGRDDVFYTCTACHSTALIRRSAFPRARWDQLLTWMSEVHGMAEPTPEERRLLLDYLASAYGERERAYTNPFLRR